MVQVTSPWPGGLGRSRQQQEDFVVSDWPRGGDQGYYRPFAYHRGVMCETCWLADGEIHAESVCRFRLK